MKNKRLEIDERLSTCIAEKDRAGCRGWLQYRIQGKYGLEDFERLFEDIEAQGGSFVWEEFEDSSLPPINDNENEWTEEYLQVVLTTLKFNFSKERFNHAIRVACALRPAQDLGNHGIGQNLKTLKEIGEKKIMKAIAENWVLNDIADSKKHN